MAAVIAIHAVLAFAFLNLSGKLSERELQDALQVFDVGDVPPPPPPPVIEQPQLEQAEKKEGAPAPKNIESEASPVVAPKPKVVIPAPSPVVAAPTPRQGPDPSQGAAPVAGPGTGAGGAGMGMGSGGSGTGPGGGGGGTGEGVRVIRGITGRDYPDAIRRNWPRGGQIFVRLRVEADGRISKCDIMRSFGDSAADQWTCPLMMRRAQLRPATDENGRPVAAWLGYVQRDF